MKTVDWATSKVVANMVDARISECLSNVVRAFLDYRTILPEDAVHVEGLYWYGGQIGLHTWIETENHIIELSLVRETNRELRETVRHYRVLTRDETEIKNLYGDRPRTPGSSLIMELNWDDPKVEKLANEIDSPPKLRFRDDISEKEHLHK